MALNLSPMAWLALALFVIQNGCAAIILNVTQRSSGYSSQVAVLMQELAIKLPLCGLFYMVECGGPMRAVRSLVTDASERSDEWLKMSVPALLYTVQNNCLYIGFHHLEAAVGQVTYQSKIFFTAFFSVVLLGKKLHAPQWAALVLLAAGVVCVQGLDRLLKSAESTTPHKTGRHHHPRPGHTAGAKARPGPGRGLAELDFVPSTMIGLVAFLVASLCTSFASVYFEKVWLPRSPSPLCLVALTPHRARRTNAMRLRVAAPSVCTPPHTACSTADGAAPCAPWQMLKSASMPSLWLRNIQLAVYSSIIASAYLASQDDAAIREGGWFHGFNIGTWLSITWQAGGGILVAGDDPSLMRRPPALHPPCISRRPACPLCPPQSRSSTPTTSCAASLRRSP